MRSFRFNQDVIVASAGVCKAGDVITKEQAGESWGWLLANNVGEEVIDDGLAAGQTPAEEVGAANDGGDSTESTSELNDDGSSTEGSSTETVAEVSGSEVIVQSDNEAAIVATVKSLLAKGKLRTDILVAKSGLTEEVLNPVMTEQNGFRKNQQGWWGLS